MQLDYESFSAEGAEPITRYQRTTVMRQIAALVPNTPYVCKGRRAEVGRSRQPVFMLITSAFGQEASIAYISVKLFFAGVMWAFYL
jgi:hypothetical protein